MGRSWLARQSQAPLIGNALCVANLLVNLLAGRMNHHWTRNPLASRERARRYVSVGSNSNVAKRVTIAELGRAAIWEVDTHSGRIALLQLACVTQKGSHGQPQPQVVSQRRGERRTLSRSRIGADRFPDEDSRNLARLSRSRPARPNPRRTNVSSIPTRACRARLVTRPAPANASLRRRAP